MTQATVLLALTEQGLGLARRLAPVVPQAEIHGLRGRAEGAEHLFEDMGGHLQTLFLAGHPIVGLCASGILIRTLAPVLADKSEEPPVLAVAEDGGAVAPLLGGHRGANELARRLATALGVAPAITTAGDRRFAVALDAPPPGWRLANPQHHKAFAAALLAGAKPRLTGDAPWLVESALPFDTGGSVEIAVSDAPLEGSERRLVYHPQQLAVGVGCERGCEAGELADLVRRTLADARLAAPAVAGVFSIDLKADEPAVEALAQELEVPLRFFDAAALEAETARLANPSEEVFAAVGAHGVAEAAALAAAGPEATLVAPKAKSDRATCAIARAPAPIDIAAAGRPRGRLVVLGTGPGAAGWRTAEIGAALDAVTDVVGYRLYLDILGRAIAGKRRHDFDLGQEEQRVRHALDLAADGRAVALVSSGDPGIYAMAAVVFELLDRDARPAWRRLAVEVLPGVSALQAAAARIGAPLGHDFCAISLSDLLTPWLLIEQRLRAAAEGDFVVALFNPVSQRRRQQLSAAKDILLARRPGDTPVVLARSLGRDGETVRVVDLADLDPDAVDMLTLVIVGSGATRRVERSDGGYWVYTPRGYPIRAQAQHGEML